MREFVASTPVVQEMLKEILQREGKYVRNSNLHKKRKIIREEINEGKIKTLISFLTLIDLTDNSLFKIIVIAMYRWKWLINEMNDSNDTGRRGGIRNI